MPACRTLWLAPGKRKRLVLMEGRTPSFPGVTPRTGSGLRGSRRSCSALLRGSRPRKVVRCQSGLVSQLPPRTLRFSHCPRRRTVGRSVGWRVFRVEHLVAVLHPLPEVAGHIVQSERVGLKAAHRRQSRMAVVAVDPGPDEIMHGRARWCRTCWRADTPGADPRPSSTSHRRRPRAAYSHSASVGRR